MPLFRRLRPRHNRFTTHPAGSAPVDAAQHRELAMYQLHLAQWYPKHAGDYLAAAQVHMLAALLSQNKESEAMTTVAQQRLADWTVQSLLTGIGDLLNPPRSAHVRIFHTVADPTDALTTYSDSDPLVEVYAYVQTDVFPGTGDHAIADIAMRMFGNTAAITSIDDHGEEYRRRGNRPLGEGDVVAVDGRFYRCNHFGWIPVPSPNFVPSGSSAHEPPRNKGENS